MPLISTRTRILQVVRIDGSEGFVSQVSPSWPLGIIIGWQDWTGLQHADIREAEAECRRAFDAMNGTRGKVVARS